MFEEQEMAGSCHHSHYQLVKAAKDQGEKTQILYSLSTLYMISLAPECKVVHLLPQVLQEHSIVKSPKIGKH
jgi:hypothetical protein